MVFAVAVITPNNYCFPNGIALPQLHLAVNFPTTHWSVLAVASLNGGTASREALEQFCFRYRPVVLEFVQFARADDPEDVTQEFFLRLLESRAWKRADRARGRFRSFSWVRSNITSLTCIGDDRRKSEGQQSPIWLSTTRVRQATPSMSSRFLPRPMRFSTEAGLSQLWRMRSKPCLP